MGCVWWVEVVEFVGMNLLDILGCEDFFWGLVC